jgi:hypothetical protein
MSMRAQVIALVAAAALAGPARALEKCPVTDADSEKAGSYALAVDAAIGGAADCDRANAVLAVCSLGSSADNALSDLVTAKCEPLFLAKASGAVKKAYDKAKRRCDGIAERNSGTMYQSFAAVCRAQASRDFARKYGAKQ